MPTLKNVPANSSENTDEGDSFFDAFRDMVRPFAQTLAEDIAISKSVVASHFLVTLEAWLCRHRDQGSPCTL